MLENRLIENRLIENRLIENRLIENRQNLSLALLIQNEYLRGLLMAQN